MAAKFTGCHELEGVSFQIQNVGGAGPVRTITIADGDWYVLGDATTGDLVQEIVDQVQAHAELAAFASSVSSDGVVSFTMDDDTVITWTTSGESLRDLLRFSGSTTAFDAAGVSGARTHLGGLYPSSAIVTDLPDDEQLVSQSLVDSGDPQTHSYGTREATVWEMTIEGQPYTDAAYNEFHALASFIKDWCGAGRRFRYYRDASQTAAYAEVSNPNGYIVRVADAESVRRWHPVPLVGGWYAYWTQYLRGIAHSGT